MRKVFLEKGTIIVQKVAQPRLDEHSVLVSVHYSFISSGTEAATISDTKNNTLFTNIPQKVKAVLASLSRNGVEGTKGLIKGKLKGTLQALGFSCSGRVIAVGSKVKTLRVGDFVACAGSDFAHHADIVCVPENLVAAVPNHEFLRETSITTLGAIALQAVRRAQLQIGETVCVQGLGLIGQITVQLAKAAGCTVIGVDLIPERVALAKELGADHAFEANDHSLQKNIDFLTYHKGVDCTLITASSSSNDIVQQAMNFTRKKGKVVLVGDVGLKLERDPFYKKEIDFLISCSYGPGRYDPFYEQEGNDYPYSYVRWTEKRNMQAVIDLITKGSLKVDRLISKEFQIDQASKAYDLLKSQNLLGVVLTYGPKNDFEFVPAVKEAPSLKKNLTFVPAKKGSLQVGVVGAGGFAKSQLLPLVSKVPGVKINAVADADITNAENVSRTYGAVQAFGQEQELFEQSSVDVVVIASPHKFHSDQAVQALCAGKAVFMEKPMVTTFDQFKTISTFLKDNPNAPFCVDYNRSFAPFIQKIKWETLNRYSPLVITYRMNAGYVSPEHWMQREVGAGRVIGEACHIIDLFCFLTGSTPRTVSVEALRPARDDLFPTDNFSVQISFDDGSICSLVYTSIGHTALGKERMELFFDSKSIVMDDYLTLRGYGTSHAFSETVAIADKGHNNLITRFFENLKQDEYEAPISISRLNTVAELTLIIDDLVCQGGGEKIVPSVETELQM